MFKEKIDLNEVLFHGLSWKSLDIKKKRRIELKHLVNIIRAGGIVSRKGIRENFGEQYYKQAQENFCKLNWNGEDYVSICTLKSPHRKKADYSEAFNLFVRGGTCLIINKRILKEVENRQDGLEDGEIQIKDKVDFKYIIGIGLGGCNFNDGVEHCKNTWNFTREQSREFLLDHINSERINNIKKILSFYGIDLPIYSTIDGRIFKPLEQVLDDVYGAENNFTKN